MSVNEEKLFRELVQSYFQKHDDSLALKQPVFHSIGAILTACLSGVKGDIEIITGPPSYRAELIIHLKTNKEQRELADLQKNPEVMSWWKGSRYDREGKTPLESDIEWIFCLLVECLSATEEYSWLGSQ